MCDLETSLRKVPWHSVAALQGTCSHVPDSILSLVSSDPSVRESAYWNLDNRIVVQGGLFEGAFYVVPFLLQICRNDFVKGRIESLELLYELAAGASSFDKQVRFSTVATPFSFYLPDPDAIAVPLTIAVRFAIACGLDSIISYTVSLDETERRHSQALVELFPEFAGDISERLARLAVLLEFDQIRTEIYRLTNALRA
jgi:hypothetical protein